MELQPHYGCWTDPPRVMIGIDMRVDMLSPETMGCALRDLIAAVGCRPFRFYVLEQYDPTIDGKMLTLQAVSHY